VSRPDGHDVAWDYTALAAAYLDRPDYAPVAIDAMLAVAGRDASSACDIGAGVGHLTLPLLREGLDVIAVEPNAAMMELGRQRTSSFPKVKWVQATGEDTGQAESAFDLVTFGSSFNVTDREAALRESERLLRPGGWFACMWNHRDLNDPLQARIERVISDSIPGYDYGTRRQDQTEVIEESGLFGPVLYLRSRVLHHQEATACIRAWRSHATLQRQAGNQFEAIVDRISAAIGEAGPGPIAIPYDTSIWMARRLDA